MTNCTNCGQELHEGARFCPHCGTPVGSAEAPEHSPPFAEEQGTEEGPIVTSQVPRDARNIAMLCHLIIFVGYIIPFGHIVGPLLVWLLRREDSPFIDFHGKEALNFQISMTIYIIVSIILVFVVIGIPLLIGLLVFEVITVIVAAIRASAGQEFRYPLTVRFIK